ncbi:DeoR/GlpR family DNA-binding transcription regulator [Flavobacterium gawalongense]|uniref:DeoR/GlpR transcriptional regulator n=1 Tax=Flavobacterium gawalongense TaxID=2594432 RepID=A0A553BJ61_9FLAO|nr:DeoR/GlpR family DNA-binding transcription regulator [Flavobacterium gawalongense]TRX08288.1 DeoR/GlpR transcriptional regulator [Flavobacterium gawalongense]TRX09032.1 DeoR/GlpR transcriptional regulator [Flavobacterium gawalongense]TRX25276.1 DeoR/GlpR transcriptional regulator [Flavobacterium gawalongense]
MTIINRRQEDILKELNQKGYVNVVDLCEIHNVSTVTIRKDLNFLENEKLLHRTHGGASKQPIYAFERDVNDKEGLQVEQKKQIAKEALKYIDNNDYVILGSGSNIHYLSRIITGFPKLTVLTPSLRVSLELSKETKIDTIQLGGDVRNSSTSVVGPIAEATLSQFSCNKLFLGADGIHLDFGLSTSNSLEAHLNQAMIDVSEKIIVLADSTKMNIKGFGKICNLDKIDVLITDSGIDPETKTKLEEIGIYVVVADKM